MRDIPTQITGGNFAADDFNDIPNELEGAILSTGQTLSSADLYQLAKAVAAYSAGGDYYTDSGTADNYVLTPVGSKKSPPAYFAGMKIRFRAGANNTGACNANAGALGVKSIKLADGTTDPQAGDINILCDTTLVYDGTNLRIEGIKKSRLDVVGNIAVGGIVEKTMSRIYSNELSAAVTSLTIPSLNGNVDLDYQLRVYLKAGHATGDVQIGVRPNNDSGANYTDERLSGSGTSALASTTSVGTQALIIPDTRPTANNFGMGVMDIFAKSGNYRMFLAKGFGLETTAPLVGLLGTMWKNTANNITSLTIFANQTNGLGVGTRVELYARR